MVTVPTVPEIEIGCAGEGQQKCTRYDYFFTEIDVNIILPPKLRLPTEISPSLFVSF
jgi:hypothetical protein